MNPVFELGMIAATVVVGRWWLADFRSTQQGRSDPRHFPGATAVAGQPIVIAVVGALLLLALETAGESLLGISAQQTKMSALAGLASLAAAFIEELVFRGYLVLTHRGRKWLLASMVAGSLLFALLHPYLWEWKDGRLEMNLQTKAWYSTAAIFLGSLWFYWVRFQPSNPRHSLLPCFAAHAAKNLGVFVIKGSQGFVEGWF